MIGNIAAILTTLSFLPQALQVIKTKNTEGISLGMYTIFVLGVFLWSIYGYINKDMPVLLANALHLFLSSIMSFLKLNIQLKRK